MPPGKAIDLRKATTLHKSLLPRAAFVIENVAYMEMPWQNIFLLLRCCFSIFLVYRTTRRILVFSLVFVLLIRRKSASQVPPLDDLTVSHALSPSLYLCLSCFLPCLCVCVRKLSGVCQFISISIQFFASLDSQLNFMADAGSAFVYSIVLELPSVPPRQWATKINRAKNANSLYYKAIEEFDGAML